MNTDKPRLVFWELTKRCNLRCSHCRAEADESVFEGELTTGQIKAVIDNIASFASPIIVLTGGEPLYRDDIYEIASYVTGKGMPAALATNGTMIDNGVALRIKEAGVRRVSISIDGVNADSHDGIRGIPGSFDSALAGARELREAGVEFQFNATITRRNKDELEGILKLSVETGAAALHLFMLVPVGCGAEIAETEALDRNEYESVLNRFYDLSKEASIEFKATCAPHYYRIIRQRARGEGRSVTFESHGMAAMTRGCLAGSGVCFISHRGEVQPCGYLPLKAGSVAETAFRDIWEHSELFLSLRNMDLLKGKCGVCEYRNVCAGCRARAYYAGDDLFGEEPFCLYTPRGYGG